MLFLRHRHLHYPKTKVNPSLPFSWSWEMKVSASLLCLFGAFVLEISIIHANHDNSLNCSRSHHVIGAIGGLVEKKLACWERTNYSDRNGYPWFLCCDKQFLFMSSFTPQKFPGKLSSISSWRYIFTRANCIKTYLSYVQFQLKVLFYFYFFNFKVLTFFWAI